MGLMLTPEILRPMSYRILPALLGLTVATTLLGCETPATTTTEDTSPTVTDATETGTLALLGNAEERPQVGFTSVDGWALSFDHIYVHFSDLRAYQVDPPYDYSTLTPIQGAQVEVSFPDQTVDLVTGDEDNPTVPIATLTDAPTGHYNAISWQMTPAPDGPSAGSSLVIIGTAERDGETIAFTLNLEKEFSYYCGEFIGDERQGILAAGEAAEVEATLHFDHLFGEGSKPADDPINQTALGFDPLAALAVDGQVEVDFATLQAVLTPADLERLESSLAALGHAGEGHCFEAISGQTS